jgi:metallophosphoesterase (TIGR03767 family)
MARPEREPAFTSQHASRVINRRTLLAGTLAAVGLRQSQLPYWFARGAVAAPSAPDPMTTLTRSAVLGDPLTSGLAYRRLVPDAGWPLVVREELAAAASDRAARRRCLAAFAHLTDIHVVDAASPAHPAFLRQYPGGFAGAEFTSGFRPQETLTGHVVNAMVQRINGIAAGPISGRPFDFAITTGDNADSRAEHELRAMLAAVNGGTIAVNAAGGRYQGIQDNSVAVPPASYDAFWHPEPAPATFGDDAWKRESGFPTLPGFLDAVSRPIAAQGLSMPWYGGFGNHDIVLMGVLPDGSSPARFLELLATGDQLPLAVPPGMTVEQFLQDVSATSDEELRALIARMPKRTVPAAPGRAPFTRQDFIRMHLEHSGRSGPEGHGFSQRNLDANTAYYTFAVAPEVLGVMLDSTNPNGGPDGSLDPEQAEWLEARLIEAHARYLDRARAWVETGNEDRLVVLFSHHNSRTFDNLATAPGEGQSDRLDSAAFEALLRRFPNVILWVNGHTHTNRVWAHPDPSGRTPGFWEVNTAAHIDYPQQARAIEIFDNGDGTLSVTGVMIDHSDAGSVPAGPPYSPVHLAALALELAANDPALDLPLRLGEPTDRNVELVIRRRGAAS